MGETQENLDPVNGQPNVHEDPIFLPDDFGDWEENKPVQAPDIIELPPLISGIISEQQIISSQEWAFFTLVPVYEIIRADGKKLIDFDLVSQFLIESGIGDADHHVYIYNKLVFESDLIRDNKNVLECLPCPLFKQFKAWIGGASFCHKTVIEGKHGEADSIRYDTWIVKSGSWSIFPTGDTTADLGKITIFLPYSNVVLPNVQTIEGKLPKISFHRVKGTR